MSEYGDEYAEVYDAEWRKAAKPHTCHACGEIITAGRKYHRTFTVFERVAHSNIRCERCQVIFTHLEGRIRAAGDYTEYCNSELDCGHEYKERWGEEPPPEIAALAFWLPGDPLP